MNIFFNFYFYRSWVTKRSQFNTQFSSLVLAKVFFDCNSLKSSLYILPNAVREEKSSGIYLTTRIRHACGWRWNHHSTMIHTQMRPICVTTPQTRPTIDECQPNSGHRSHRLLFVTFSQRMNSYCWKKKWKTIRSHSRKDRTFQCMPQCIKCWFLSFIFLEPKFRWRKSWYRKTVNWWPWWPEWKDDWRSHRVCSHSSIWIRWARVGNDTISSES